MASQRDDLTRRARDHGGQAYHAGVGVSLINQAVSATIDTIDLPAGVRSVVLISDDTDGTFFGTNDQVAEGDDTQDKYTWTTADAALPATISCGEATKLVVGSAATTNFTVICYHDWA